MKTFLIITFLLALLLTITIEVQATVCIEDVASGELWCEPESPVAQSVYTVFLPVVGR